MEKPFFQIKNDLENEKGAKHYGWKNPSEMFCARTKAAGLPAIK